jgi:hypothetical protein
MHQNAERWAQSGLAVTSGLASYRTSALARRLPACVDRAGLNFQSWIRGQLPRSCTTRLWCKDQAGGNSRLAWNSAKYLANIASVSITSVKPACISLIVETIAGGPGSLRP